MQSDRELMQQALDALESECDATKFGAAEALRARLAQPEQPQIVWIDNKQTGNFLNTAPPQREWQGLTDEEIEKIEMSASSILSAIYLAEAQLKGKNAL